jgi:hypothetical protein
VAWLVAEGPARLADIGAVAAVFEVAAAPAGDIATAKGVLEHIVALVVGERLEVAWQRYKGACPGHGSEAD